MARSYFNNINLFVWLSKQTYPFLHVIINIGGVSLTRKCSCSQELIFMLVSLRRNWKYHSCFEKLYLVTFAALCKGKIGITQMNFTK